MKRVDIVKESSGGEDYWGVYVDGKPWLLDEMFTVFGEDYGPIGALQNYLFNVHEMQVRYFSSPDNREW